MEHMKCGCGVVWNAIVVVLLCGRVVGCRLCGVGCVSRRSVVCRVVFSKKKIFERFKKTISVIAQKLLHIRRVFMSITVHFFKKKKNPQQITIVTDFIHSKKHSNCTPSIL